MVCGARSLTFMTDHINIILCVLWYLVGVIPAFWFAHARYDITRLGLFVIFLAGFLGWIVPTYLVGWFLEEWLYEGRGKIIVPKRRP